MEYLAGRHLNLKLHRTFIARHTGVQFCDNENDADLVTAFLLFAVCSQPKTDLGEVRVILSTMSEQLHSFMTGYKPSLQIEVVSGRFCKTKVVTVQLLCDCFIPWIEGSTSAAIYGTRQKEFNMHLCCKCKMWYHSYCLSKLGISPPNRRVQFMCHHCTVPMTLEWGAETFTNTCTVDNFLTTLMLHCKEHPGYLSTVLNVSDSEDVLKTGIMLKRSTNRSKTQAGYQT